MKLVNKLYGVSGGWVAAVLLVVAASNVIVDLATGGQTVLPGAENVDFGWGVAVRDNDT